MDPSVKDAIARWPDVPAVFGWLSLDPRGRWRLHPQGQAAAGGPGESITNPQIQGFIDRNYEHDEAGRWFFQNGPQRVFLRLDAAPYVLRLDDAGRALLTHTGQPVGAVSGWWLDDAGQLYAMASQGPGVVLDRDLPPLMERLVTDDGAALLDVIDRLAPSQSLRIALPGVYDAAPLRLIDRAQVPDSLGFQANPTA
ncbi:MAG: DUF2946 family protein [Achromobacter sp.]|jgi:hypothetical protein|uniref:DUF2946 domain-containing protein n=1 Tax=Achromobacter insuavis TaxID=1287735 RepID=A0A6J4ZGY5_9BURK|nr:MULTISPECIES: DUF2946 family protein [Achromobacter]MBN9640488.1 DUF2946 family protein [Achromobacter sp.]MCG2598362.1 DUF2946 family protein [Achromobacter sp.]MCG2603234.1 DUF2946 family protein [Achromobacter sp.]CAB3623815.1 hypothetical protein LMG26845_00144 [Achromobacter insuavis]CUI94159.1 Protein of uncharacterised function (DUF2946) [Achromobacter sp. 2789STDY5608621]